MRSELSSGPAAAPLTSELSDVYAGLVRHRAASLELEQQTRQCVRDALEAGLSWSVIAAVLGVPVGTTMSRYGASPQERDEPLPALTGEEQQILTLVLEGWTNQAIAQSLYMSKRSLEAQLTALYRTLGIASKAELRTLRGTSDELARRNRPVTRRAPAVSVPSRSGDRG